MTTSDLFTLLREHSLLDENQLTRLQSSALLEEKDSESVLEALQQNEWLTPFQANLIRQGRVSELVLNNSYLLLDLLGGGGMGQVLKAKHLGLEQIRAIKTIRSGADNNPLALRRFLREMKLAAKLDHPNVIRVFDSGQSNGTHYFVMELLPGNDLSNLIAKQGQFPIGQAVDYVRQAGLGLQHAHEQGMIHRDIKPSNLWVTDQGVVKILDLGLARAAEAQGEGQTTETGAMMGTPDYIAPEQTVNAKGVDIRADIYSLGCTLYHLLTGKVPFPGGSIPAKLLRHCRKRAAPVEKLCPETPPGLVLVVNRMMAKKPESRQQSPQEVVEDLLPFCSGQTEVMRKGSSQVVPSTSATGAARPPSNSPPLTPTLKTQQASSPRASSAQQAATKQGTSSSNKIASPASSQTRAKKGNPDSLRSSSSTLRAETEKKRGSLPWLALGGVGLPVLGVALYFLVFSRTGDKPVGSSKPIAELPQTYHDHSHVTFGRDGTRVILGGSAPHGDYVQVYNVETGMPETRTLIVHDHFANSVRHVAFSPSGQRIAVATQKNALVFDARSGQQLARLAHANEVVRCVFLPDGKQLVTASAFSPAILWDLKTEQQLFQFGLVVNGEGERKKCLVSVALSPNGKTAVYHYSEDGNKGQITLWDTATGQQTGTLEEASYCSQLRFSPDGRLVVAEGMGSNVWDVQSGERLKYDSALQGYSASLSPDGKLLVHSDSEVAKVEVVSLEAGKPRFTVRTKHSNTAISPDGKLFATYSGSTARVWDLETGKAITDDLRHGYPYVIYAVFSPDSKRLLTVAASSTMGVGDRCVSWDVRTGKVLGSAGQEKEEFGGGGDRKEN